MNSKLSVGKNNKKSEGLAGITFNSFGVYVPYLLFTLNCIQGYSQLSPSDLYLKAQRTPMQMALNAIQRKEFSMINE